MAISDKKVTSYGGKDVASAPNVMLGTPQQNKEVFDKLMKEVLLPNYNGLIDQLGAVNASSFLGASISGSSAVTLAGVLTYIATALADRYTKAESNSNLTAAVNPLIKSVVLDTATGILTVTKQDGTVSTTDTNLEKIPASMEIVEVGGKSYLRITNDDGSYTQTDVSNLLNIYGFGATDTIAFQTTTNADGSISVTAQLKNASVTLAHLDPTVISTITGLVSQAQDAAAQAGDSAVSASASAGAAASSEQNAVLSASSSAANAQQTTLDRQATAADLLASGQNAVNADNARKLAQSYAVGGTGARPDEATNNAKYWAEQARESVSGDYVLNATIGEAIVPKVEGVLKLPAYPTTLPPMAHSHPVSDISNFPISMPPTDHGHSVSDITGLNSVATTGYVTKGMKTGTVLGSLATAEGAYNTASGDRSHAEGIETMAVATAAHAEGISTKAEGVYTHAEGSNTSATGYAAHSEGSYAVAGGNYSHAQNYYTIANGHNQTAIGKYNIEDTTSAFIIGNGTFAGRSNALSVAWDGTIQTAKGLVAPVVLLPAGTTDFSSVPNGCIIMIAK